jgi:hypothetical protein
MPDRERGQVVEAAVVLRDHAIRPEELCLRAARDTSGFITYPKV